jgi:hypothetical protein
LNSSDEVLPDDATQWRYVLGFSASKGAQRIRFPLKRSEAFANAFTRPDKK